MFKKVIFAATRKQKTMKITALCKNLVILTLASTSFIGLSDSAFAQRISLRALGESSISVEDGKFIFSNLKMKRDGGVYKLTGNFKDTTSKKWIDSRNFNVNFFNKDGQIIKTSEFLIYKAGKNIDFDENVYFGASQDKPVEYEINFKKGEYDVIYNFSLVKPVAANDISFSDKYISVAWDISENQVGFTLTNKTNEPIKINWDQASFVDINGSSKQVIHSGVRYINRDSPQVPTIIPPTAKLNEIIVPKTNIYYGYSNWKVEPIFPEGPLAKSYANKEFSVFLPLEIEGKSKYYSFTFRINNIID
jgi:hypothetical protein